MPIRVSDLTGKTRQLSVKWEGEILHFTYDPSANSLADSMALQEELEGDSTRQYKALVDRLVRVMPWWDVVEETADNRLLTADGEDSGSAVNGQQSAVRMLPITEDNLMLLPEELVSAIFRAIRESQEPNPPRSRR